MEQQYQERTDGTGGKYAHLIERQRGYVYLPLSQRPSGALVLAVRTPQDGPAFEPALRRTVRAIDPDLPLYQFRTFETALAGAADKQQAASSMVAVFGALALVLAALGIYGVTAHGVALRRKEVGIRMSLGARGTDVLALFVGEGMRRSTIGVALGLAVSASLSKLPATFLFGLSASDAMTFVLAAVVLYVAAGVASYLPARRAAKVDPIISLRTE